MADTVAVAQEKKALPLDKKEAYDIPVTVKQWVAGGAGMFLNELPTVAMRTKIDGKDVLYIWTAGTSIKTPAKSEITETKTGDVWVVTETKKSGSGTTRSLNYVTKKLVDAKKP